MKDPKIETPEDKLKKEIKIEKGAMHEHKKA